MIADQQNQCFYLETTQNSILTSLNNLKTLCDEHSCEYLSLIREIERLRTEKIHLLSKTSFLLKFSSELDGDDSSNPFKDFYASRIMLMEREEMTEKNLSVLPQNFSVSNQEVKAKRQGKDT
jgi:hypothetical protein